MPSPVYTRAVSGAALALACGLLASGCDVFADGDVLPETCSTFYREPVEDCSVDGKLDYVLTVMEDVYLWSDQLPAFDGPADRAAFLAAQYPEDWDPTAEMTQAEQNAPVQTLMRNLRYCPPEHETDSMVPCDRFSGVQNKVQRDDFFERGKTFGLGWIGAFDASIDALRVALVYEGSPAWEAGMRRPMTILEINGKTIAEINAENLWATIEGPNDEEGLVVEYLVETPDGERQTLTPAKGDVFISPVMNTQVLDVPDLGKVGYVYFHAFIQPAVDALTRAFERLKADGAEHVVVDLRYNGGGLLSVAAQLGSLIGGRPTKNEPLAVATFNDRCSALNDPLAMTVEDGAIGATTVGFVQTGNTFSASELVINGLEPFTPVSTAGSTSGGKPLGAHTFDYCDIAVSPITFEYLNANGEGRFYQGIEPDCPAPDDLTKALGDPTEGALAAVLSHMKGDGCPNSDPASRGLPAAGLSRAAAPTFSRRTEPMLWRRYPGERHPMR